MDGDVRGPVAVLGLGTMGGRAAGRLRETGVPVTGYDPVPAARDLAAGQGVTVFLASDSLTAHYNVTTATAVDDDNTPTTDDDDETVTFDECLRLSHAVLDQTAFALCRDHGLDVVVFDMRAPGSLRDAAAGEPIGTRVVR